MPGGGGVVDAVLAAPGEGRPSAQDQQVEPVAPRRGVGVSNGASEAFLAAAELLLSEAAHGGVREAEGVHLAEELRKARRVDVPDRFEGDLVEPGAGERRAVSSTDG